MQTLPRAEWPEWLQRADTVDAIVTVVNGVVIWHGGEWHGGTWLGGRWLGGVWLGGTWLGGEWLGGTWLGGTWCDTTIDRVRYMAALCGIAFDSRGRAVGYRSTNADGSGRYTSEFVQPEGEWYDEQARPRGSGVCVPGIHVSNAVSAYTYFDVDPTAQLWRVEFAAEDLLDCDGEKARIRGGVFERIPWPWANE